MAGVPARVARKIAECEFGMRTSLPVSRIEAALERSVRAGRRTGLGRIEQVRSSETSKHFEARGPLGLGVLAKVQVRIDPDDEAHIVHLDVLEAQTQRDYLFGFIPMGPTSLGSGFSCVRAFSEWLDHELTSAPERHPEPADGQAIANARMIVFGGTALAALFFVLALIRWSDDGLGLLLFFYAALVLAGFWATSLGRNMEATQIRRELEYERSMSPPLRPSAPRPTQDSAHADLVAERRCPACGSDPEEGKFCSQCGAAVTPLQQS